ncbi:MAG: hypothetical protein JSV88_27540, partial [Candidatus Aminicenantes bacterium]
MSQQNNIIKSGTAVVGFGKTGKGVLDFLLEEDLIKSFCGVRDRRGRFFQKEPLTAGGKIYLFNDTPIGGDDVVEKRGYEEKGVVFLEGEDQFNRLQGVGLIILSPGVDGRAPRFSKLREKGAVIISEIELAFGFIPGSIPIIAVTGTNGKSTTVSLVHHLLKSGGINSFLTGNIGTPLISQVGRISREGEAVVVLEVSSFQLEEI